MHRFNSVLTQLKQSSHRMDRERIALTSLDQLNSLVGRNLIQYVNVVLIGACQRIFYSLMTINQRFMSIILRVIRLVSSGLPFPVLTQNWPQYWPIILFINIY